MLHHHLSRMIVLAVALFTLPATAEIVLVRPGPDAQARLQQALTLAEPGDEIRLGAGVFVLTAGLSLDVDRVAVRGAGPDRTILSFKGQEGGGAGLHVTGDEAVLIDFAVEDTRADAVKALGVDGIALVRLRVAWTDGPAPANGAYGLYAIQSRHVLIDNVEAIGASGAGIRVGQSQDIVVRNSTVRLNVAGIEIATSTRADIYGNTAVHNTGGIVLFDRPTLPQQGGHHVRVFGNRTIDNNTPNFAPPGHVGGMIPAGTGLLIVANRDVEVFDNDFDRSGTAHLILASSFEADATERSPPRRIHIHGNRFGIGGDTPDPRAFGTLIADTIGTPVPAIVWDGVVPLRQWLFGQPEADKIHLGRNTLTSGQTLFGNANLLTRRFIPPVLHRPSFNTAPYAGRLPALAPVENRMEAIAARVDAGGNI